MAFLEELGKTITDKGKEAAKKAKEITSVLQLKSQVSAEKEKVNDAYIELGKAYYDKHEASIEEEFPKEFETIRAGLMTIAELEDRICELEGNRSCAECGAKLDKGAMFCSKCGAPVEEVREEKAREEKADTTTVAEPEETLDGEPGKAFAPEAVGEIHFENDEY